MLEKTQDSKVLCSCRNGEPGGLSSKPYSGRLRQTNHPKSNSLLQAILAYILVHPPCLLLLDYFPIYFTFCHIVSRLFSNMCVSKKPKLPSKLSNSAKNVLIRSHSRASLFNTYNLLLIFILIIDNYSLFNSTISYSSLMAVIYKKFIVGI